MMEAGPAKLCLGLALVGLAPGCARTDASSDNEHTGREVHGAAEREAASGERTAAPIGRGTSSHTARAEPDGSTLRASEPVGGAWVSCYSNFRPSSTPERDVARLAALCGRENGMVPMGPILSGDVVDAAADHRFEAAQGDCFRIFAVADAFVTDLGVEVISPSGGAVTWDRNGDRWPILNPDGPFCLFDAGTYTIRARALQGKGRYALQLWRLPAP